METKNRRCMITFPAEGYKKPLVMYAVKLGADKVILLNPEKSCMSLLSSFGINVEVKAIPKNKVSEVIISTLKIISGAKKDYDEVRMLLLPSNPEVVIGMYVACCIEKVKADTISDTENEYFNLPFFPFAEINEGEKFILTKIIETGKISKRNLLEKIKKEGSYDLLYSRKSNAIFGEESLLKQLQRMLERLEKLELVSREREGRRFVWKPTSLSKFMFD